MKDIKLADDLDLLVENGDFVIGTSDEQELSALLLSAPGIFKNAPLIGADAQRYLLSGDTASLMARINRQLKADGKPLRADIASDGTISFIKL